MPSPLAIPAAREAYLLEACANDPSLRAEIESLLAAQAASTLTFRGLVAPDVPAKPPAGGPALGRYVVETLLGAGGMGEVYRARDTRLNRRRCPQGPAVRPA